MSTHSQITNPLLFPDYNQTRRPVLLPDPRLVGHDSRLQHGLPSDFHQLFPSPQSQLGAFDAGSASFRQDMSRSEPAYLSINTNNPQPSSQSLRLPPLSDPTTPSGQPPSIATAAAGSRVLGIPTSSTERTVRVCDIMHAVHDTCLQSTKTYLDSHLANRRARNNNPFSAPSEPRSSSQPRPGTDGSSSNSNTTTSSSTASGGNALHPIPTPTNSLLDNISGICGMLWAGSQNNRLHVLNVERAAVDNMSRLLCWAETVALSDPDERRTAEEGALWRVLEAGRNLCAWLGVPDGIQAMSRLESDATNAGYGAH
ncbi:hypothetical protein F4821DRAFT_277552 [Hypoxylon rubiginosum]|uniref:Uncharacterized protein n=1 Tax=Hypoxylon rubiginosum TaxID=110542 RepID=A0ACC0D5D8_9PEZI|nr:hypothetical protein F4821DRAFT_277552 [Hypoxylon rubiginosum]